MRNLGYTHTIEVIKMNWEDILKIEPYERAVAEEFASKDMQEGKDQEIQRQYEEMKPLLRGLAAKYGKYEGFHRRNDQQLYHAIIGILRSFPTAPMLAGKNQKKENLKRIYEFLGEEPPSTPREKTAGDKSFIARAKKNYDDEKRNS
tara:strand:- start:429 stop:869 length:441 start_codon:yes stop_codon:yes gene_type:complete